MRDDIKINETVVPLSDQIIQALSDIYDPEIGLDIYNLGLIYEIEIDDQAVCDLTMTFTGVACSCIDTVPGEIQESLKKIDGINKVNVHIVWQPAWNMVRISRLGRITLGINPN